jgi:hypothetical protein
MYLTKTKMANLGLADLFFFLEALNAPTEASPGQRPVFWDR